MSDSDAPLKGRVCIVTGAAQGIGLSIAQHLCRGGAAVIVADIQLDKARTAADRLRDAGHIANAVPVDVRRLESAQEMVAQAVGLHGQVDVLVNNAGLDSPTGFAWEMEPKQWNDVIDVDLSGQWWCTSAVLPHMMTRRSGRIIFISSISARRASAPAPGTAAEDVESVAYNAAKAGLIGLTIGLSAHLESTGILVNAIAPGPTGTGRPFDQSAYQARYPLGVGGPEPVAQACLYLIGPSGDWISGSVLNVSGGGWRGY